MSSYLLDTNIMVDTLRNLPAAVEYVDSLGDWSYSVVCKMELIAATAITSDLKLATQNEKHFRNIDNLQLEIVNWRVTKPEISYATYDTCLTPFERTIRVVSLLERSCSGPTYVRPDP